MLEPADEGAKKESLYTPTPVVCIATYFMLCFKHDRLPFKQGFLSDMRWTLQIFIRFLRFIFRLFRLFLLSRTSENRYEKTHVTSLVATIVELK